jgi:signal transduction histidine kinase
MGLGGILHRVLAARPGRMGSVFLVGGGLVGAVASALPGPSDMNRPGLAAIGALAAGVGLVTWCLPWERWPWWSNLLVLPFTFTILSVGNVFSGYAPYSYGSFYVVFFVWLGMAHRPGIPLLISPLMVASYLVPLLTFPGDFGIAATSLLLVLPTCVMVGEMLAWFRVRLTRTEGQLRAYSTGLEEANRTLAEQDRALRVALEQLRRVEMERRSLLDRTVDSQEAERKRIAFELHDGPIQHLTALDVGLETIRRRLEGGDPEAAIASLARVQETARDDVHALRHLMKDLRPPVLDDAGLESALLDLVGALEASSGVPFSANVRLAQRLDPTLEMVLYRVAEEALTNVVKHALARRAALTVEQTDEGIVLEVRDDGRGLPENEPLGAPAHYGLLGMRQRVEMVGGTCEIGRNRAGGTTVRAVVPACDGAGSTPSGDGPSRDPVERRSPERREWRR